MRRAQVARVVASSGVQRERAAAALRRRRDDVAAFGGEHADGGLVDVAEEHALHAAGEQADAWRAGARRRRALRHAAREAPSAVRRERDERRSRGGSSAAGRRSTERAATGRQSAAAASANAGGRIRQRRRRARARNSAIGDRPRGCWRSICARVSSMSGAVLHARRTGRHARQAAEARVEVLRRTAGQRDASVEARLHQVDAAARRVHLLAATAR